MAATAGRSGCSPPPVASAARSAVDTQAVVPTAGIGQVGTAVLCEVTRLGAYRKIETTAGVEIPISIGSRFVGVLANRGSTHSFYGHVPCEGVTLPAVDEYDLLAVGGVVGCCTSFPSRLGPPTRVRLLAGAASADKPARLQTSTERVSRFGEGTLRVECPLVLVCGTTAEVGKTTFAANLIRHLARDGRSVGAAKLAGTGRMRDLEALRAAGAVLSLDFVDGGLPTTYLADPASTVAVARGICNRLATGGAEIIVAECGGDVIGGNVDALLADPQLQRSISALAIVPSDSLAAYGADRLLERSGFSHEPWFVLPSKNPAAMRAKASLLRRPVLLDGGSPEELRRFVEAVRGP